MNKRYHCCKNPSIICKPASYGALDALPCDTCEYVPKSVNERLDCFKVGDIVNMHCGEQGIVVEILDDKWVNLLQCNGHVEKAYVYDIWHAKQNGKEALHELFMKTFGYSSIYDEEELQNEEFFPTEDENIEDVPF